MIVGRSLKFVSPLTSLLWFIALCTFLGLIFLLADQAILENFGGGARVAGNGVQPVTVSFEFDSYNVDEGATTTVRVVLSQAPERSLTIPFSTSRQRGISVDDYLDVPSSVSFDASETESTFTFSATQDHIDDDGEGLRISFGSSLPAGVTVGSPMQTIVHINDDDAAGVTVSPEALEILEGGDSSYTVVLDSQPTHDVTITINSPQGSEILTLLPRLTFTATNWNVTQSVTVFANPDRDKVNDTGAITHSIDSLDNNYDRATPGDVSVTILDDDVTAVTVSFAHSSYSVAEGGTTSVEVVLSADPQRTVIIPITSADEGGATSTDYSGIPDSVMFSTGDTRAAFTVSATSDEVDDDGESVRLQFGTLPNGVSAGTVSETTIFIADHDLPAVTVSFEESNYSVQEGRDVLVKLVLSAALERAIAIPITRTGQGGATSTDYYIVPDSVVFGASETEANLTFSAIQDSLNDDGESVKLAFGDLPEGIIAGVKSEAVVSIVDDDVPSVIVSFEQANYSVAEGATTKVKLILDRNPERTVSILIAKVDLGGATSTDYAGVPDSVVFNAGEIEKAFSISATQDSLDDDSESVQLSFRDLPDGVSAGATNKATVNIIDDDVPTVTVRFDSSSYVVEEGGTTSIKVILSAPPERTVTIRLVKSPQSGISLDDYSGIPESIRFDSGRTEHSFTFSATGDRIDDDGEAVLLSFGSPLPSGITAGAPSRTKVHVTDDDMVGVKLESTMLRVEERATTSYTVVLESQPTHDVTITINAPAGAKVVTDKPRLTFTTTDWDTPQRVTVMANRDSDTDDYEATIMHRIDSSDGKYDRITPSHVTITVIDNDVPSVAVSFGQASYSVAEGATTTVKVVLDNDPERFVTVPIVTRIQGGATSTDYSGVPPSVLFSAGETEKAFTFSAIQDYVDDDGESVILTFGDLPDGVTSGTHIEGTVGIVDDDAVGVSVYPNALLMDEGATSTYLVVLDSQPLSDVTVTINGPADNPDVTASPESLTYTTLIWNVAQPVTVSAEDDNDGDDDTAIVTHTVTSTDSDYAGIEVSPVRVTVADRDEVSVKVGFEQGSYMITEGSTTTLWVVLDRDPKRTVSISISGIEQDGASEGDYTGVPPSVVFNAGETQKSFTFAAIKDGVDDDGESVRLSLSDLPDRVSLGMHGTTTVTIIDEDVPTVAVSFERSTYVLSEGSTATVSVVLNHAPERSIAIPIISTGMNGATSTDYSGVPDYVVFGQADSEKSFAISATQDSLNDDGESVRLSFGDLPEGVSAGIPNETTVSIVDDDVPSVSVSFDQAMYSVAEGATTTVKVSLSADPERSVSITLIEALQGGIGLDDYSGVPESIVFVSGETEHSFTFSATDDHIDEDDESLRLSFNLPLPKDITAGTRREATVHIADDDRVGVAIAPSILRVQEHATTSYTVVLNSQPTHDVTIRINSPSGLKLVTDKPRLVFTGSDWYMPQNVTVVANPDIDTDDYEGMIGHTVDSIDSKYDRLMPGNVTVTVIDDDVPLVNVSFGRASYHLTEGATTTVKVVLDKDPERTVTIPIVTTTQGGATSTDFSGVPDSVAFNAGETDSTFTFAANQDSIDDDGESIKLTFGVLPEEVTEGATNEAIVSITDDDAPSVIVSFEQATYSVEEGATTTVKLFLDSDPERSVTIPIVRVHLSGATSTDYSGVPKEVVFDPGETEKSFEFMAVQDFLDDDNESVRLSISDLPDQVSVGIYSETVSNIVDDDVPQVDVSFERASYNLEEGSRLTITMLLSAAPERSIEIELSQAHLNGITDADYSNVPEKVVFDSNSTETSFTLLATDDAIDDDTESLTLTLGPSLPSNVVATGQSQATVFIVDDDTASVSVEPTSITIAERATSTYTVVLGSQPTHDVILDIRQPVESEISTDKARLVFSTSTWHLPQSVTVTADTDDDTADDEGVVKHSIASLDEIYNGIAPSSVEVMVIDNDVPSVTVTFGKATYRVEEGNDVTVDVMLSADPERRLVIPFEKTHQGGVSSIDYAGVVDSITFNPGDIVASFTVSTIEDSIDDDFELVKLSLVNLPEGVSLGMFKETAISISDDDVPSLAVTFGSGSYTVREGDDVSIRVGLSNDPERALTIPIEKSNRKGAISKDYSGVPRSLSFSRGETEKLITFSATQDSQVEGSESVVLSLGDLPEGVSIGVFGDSTVTIVDDDFPPIEVAFVRGAYEVVEGSSIIVKVRLSDAPQRTLRIPIVHASRTGATRTDYSGVPRSLTFNPGDTENSFTLTALRDVRDEENEVVELSFGVLPEGVSEGRFANSAVIITDFEMPLLTVSFEQGMYTVAEGSTAIIRVKLSEAPSREVTIPIKVSELSGATSADYLEVPPYLTFGNDDMEVAFVVKAVADYLAEDRESIRLSFGDLPEMVVAGSYVETTIHIHDIELLPLTVSFDQPAYSVAEDSTTSIDVILDREPERPLTIPIVIVSHSSSTASEHIEAYADVAFEPGVMKSGVEFFLSEDYLYDDSEFVLLAFGQLPNQVRVGAIASTTLWIRDHVNAHDATLTFEKPEHVVAEGNSITIRMMLSVALDEGVTVSISSTQYGGLSAADYLDVPSTANFETGEKEASFTFTAARDYTHDPWESIEFHLHSTTRGLRTGDYAHTRVYIKERNGSSALQRVVNSMHDCVAAIQMECVVKGRLSVSGKAVPGYDVDRLMKTLNGNASYLSFLPIGAVNLKVYDGQRRDPVVEVYADLEIDTWGDMSTLLKLQRTWVYYLEVRWLGGAPYFIHLGM